jgi:hypothetical protein
MKYRIENILVVEIKPKERLHQIVIRKRVCDIVRRAYKELDSKCQCGEDNNQQIISLTSRAGGNSGNGELGLFVI